PLCICPIPPLPLATLFPYTTLFRSIVRENGLGMRIAKVGIPNPDQGHQHRNILAERRIPEMLIGRIGPFQEFLEIIVSDGKGNGDRKSTRLNSSHVKISYAVFCLKK